MRKITVILLLFSIVIIGGVFTGCTERLLPDEIPTVLVIVLGNHNNSKKIAIPLQDKINNVYSYFGNICVVNIDGEPSILYGSQGEMVGFYDAQYIDDSKEHYQYEKIWKRDYLDKQTTKLISEINNCSADDNEVDTLGSLQVACEALNYMEASMGGEVRKEIIICDTGLSTAGALNFLDSEVLSLLSSNTRIENDETKIKKLQKLINDLDNGMEIPELNDVKITWYGLGKVDEPQPALENIHIHNLQYIWETLLQKTGAIPSQTKETGGIFDAFISVISNEAVTYNNFVTPVIIWEEIGKDNIGKDDINNKLSSNNNDSAEKESENIITNKEPEKLAYVETPPVIKVQFSPNKAEVVSEDEALKAVKPWADNLNNYPLMRVLLVGTTANVDGGSTTLSRERANRIRDILIELGVNDERIEVIGVGANSPWHKDEWENGIFNEKIAQENRTVSILPYDSELAIEILDKFG